MTVVGADADALDDLAARFAHAATKLRSIRAQLDGALSHVAWHGSSANRFRLDWQQHHRRFLDLAATSLDDAGRAVRANAGQQRQASAPGAPAQAAYDQRRRPRPT